MIPNDLIMHRRGLLQSLAWLALGHPIRKLSALESTPRFTSDPFSAGVASGDPTAHGIVIWTRLMPDDTRTQDWQRESFSVAWQTHPDERMTRLAPSERITTQPYY